MGEFSERDAMGAMCGLMAEVSERLTGCQSPADCFCPGGPRMGRYQNDGIAIEFIRKATRAELDRVESERRAAKAGPK